MRVMTIVGTRPEIIRLSAVINKHNEIKTIKIISILSKFFSKIITHSN